MNADLLPRARLIDVLRGRAPLVGSRVDVHARRGFVSPIEARIDLGLLYEDALTEERRALAEHGVMRTAATLAKTGVARVLGHGAPHGGASSDPLVERPFIVSARVDNVTADQALERILARPGFIAFAHPHALNLARFDDQLRADLAAADAVLPDGVGLRIAARIAGTPLAANVNGTDLLPLLCRAAAERGVKLALVGAKEGVAARAAKNLRETHAGLDIALVSNGYLDERATRDVLDRVRALGRVVVLVGMGSPSQERWCRRARQEAPDATFVTVGGLFDFFAGDVPRAPLALRELGLEWAFRLAQEPRRLGKRYLLGNPLFLALAVQSAARGDRSERAPRSR